MSLMMCSSTLALWAGILNKWNKCKWIAASHSLLASGVDNTARSFLLQYLQTFRGKLRIKNDSNFPKRGQKEQCDFFNIQTGSSGWWLCLAEFCSRLDVLCRNGSSAEITANVNTKGKNLFFFGSLVLISRYWYFHFTSGLTALPWYKNRSSFCIINETQDLKIALFSSLSCLPLLKTHTKS